MDGSMCIQRLTSEAFFRSNESHVTVRKPINKNQAFFLQVEGESNVTVEADSDAMFVTLNELLRSYSIGGIQAKARAHLHCHSFGKQNELE